MLEWVDGSEMIIMMVRDLKSCQSPKPRRADGSDSQDATEPRGIQRSLRRQEVVVRRRTKFGK